MHGGCGASSICLAGAAPLTPRIDNVRVACCALRDAACCCPPGDELYGLQGPWIARQALHAYSLQLLHPRDGRPIRFMAPPPPDFASVMDALGLSLPPGADDEQQ